MKREFKITGDGSHTIFLPDLFEHYHSYHGAVEESKHVYLTMGLDALAETQTDIKIFELGFGTGLNALLTLSAATEKQLSVLYYTIEPFPLTEAEAATLNYPEIMGRTDLAPVFQQMHTLAPDQPHVLSPHFTFEKSLVTFEDLRLAQDFDLVYFDAFGPRAQSEMWEADSFEKVKFLLRPGGRMVTYCAKGAVRRRLQACGFKVEQLPGPPRKREMLRATKPG